ncbi:adenosine deaminase [Dictyobacter sp. S3.2.2.5]|uniref:adenosine deaminase n=1 Tax=Dictyobacter halimunensis TaxID=3026934 RepID=A0ABQ6FHI5_9CHLR|nr:adenosine deaminase [Dictyobacter sp. S3.2.2.5]
MNIQAYPKVELHHHLDCSLSYKVVHAIDPTVTEEIYHRDFTGPVKCTNLVDFLGRTFRGIALMQTPEHLRMVVDDVMGQLKRDNVLYAELRFAPLLHTQQGMSPEEVVEVVNEALTNAISTTGVEARLILCTLRHFDADESMHTVRLVEQFQGTNVVGLDIAGDEAGYPLDEHIAAFEYAADQGIFRTAHAGEARGAESVWETLEYLQPTRIGHGARSIEDPALIEKLREEQIHLELCPASNLQTNMYDTYIDHPINRLYQHGVSMSVNTDNRTITPVTLKQEYEHLHQHFQWGKEHFLQCNLHALRSSFLPEETRNTLVERLQSLYANCD